MIEFLRIRELSVAPRNGGPRVLRSVSLDLNSGESLGLVGESGAGKSMIAKAILGILPESVHILEGSISLGGRDLLMMRSSDRRRFIGETTALIPQDPLTALNPSRRVGKQITCKLVDILGWTRKAADSRAAELLEEVGISDPERVMRSYPHELSGGMRQRILIAAAFAAEPKLIVADEPTTALDVTVQKQILSLISLLRKVHRTSLLFVTHDLGVVSKVCGSLSVIFEGKIIETSCVGAFFRAPAHPYSAALLAATPKYTDPYASLLPMSDEERAIVYSEIELADRKWNNER
ncbi:MAG: ABC transporter ATP-binding protein [Albidovulum sp.]|nr:ABC transporter ATP-binding protein [Albidovulum sp.]